MEPISLLKRYKHYAAQGLSDTEIAARLNLEPYELISYLALQQAIRSPGRPQQHPVVDGTRVCSVCHKAKPLSQYHKDRTRPGGHAYKCKACSYQRKPSPLDNDPVAITLDALAYTEGLTALDAEEAQARSKITSLRADLEAQEHILAAINHVRATFEEETL